MADIKEYEPLWGSWYVDEKLGEGSYGKVYKVHKQEFGRTYEAAVKIISIPQNDSDIIQAKSEGLNDESARSYFQAFVTDIIQEVDLMSAFRGNSNIVSLEDHKVIERKDKIGWDIIIRMELLETLSSYIAKKPLTQAEVIKLGIHICKALELCAKHNTIHRDIKPDNIFVSQYGEYKLGDFGIARQIERTMSGLSKKGTYQYMAPEVFKGEEYGASVDIYSLGIIMYRFLNKNRAPFLPEFPNPITPHDRQESLQRRMLGEQLPAIKGINEELNYIVLKACAYNKNERFKNASDMKSSLEALQNYDSDSLMPVYDSNEDNADNTDNSYVENTNFHEYTNDRTQIIFSRKNISEEQPAETVESQIKIPDRIMKKLTLSSSILWLLMAGLTFFSSKTCDIFAFLPIYVLCGAQSILKFENKAANYLSIIYFGCYLLFSMLIDFQLFDYSALIFILSLMAITSSREKKFQIIYSISMLVGAVIIALLFLNTSRMTHYTYVSGAAAIPFLMLLILPVSMLLGESNNFSLKTDIGLALLISLQFFNIIAMIIYVAGYTKYSEILYYVISANFPGISQERFSWQLYGYFAGTIIQFLSFTLLLIIAITRFIPGHFLHTFNVKRKNKFLMLIISAILVEIIIFSAM